MLLHRQFNLLALVASLTLAASMFVTGLAVHQVRVKTAQIEHAESTVRGVTNFRYLTMETVLYGEPRARQQWHARVVSFRRALDSHAYSAAEENALLAREKSGLAVLDRLFRRIENNPPGLTDRRNAAIVSALFLTTQEMLEGGFDLIRLNRRGLERAQNRALWCGLLSMAILIALIAAAVIIIKRRVLIPVATLQRITEQVTSGDMGARVNAYSRDEIGSLGRAFDRMTTELEQSQLAMRRENAERRAAQSALVQAQDDLQAIIDHMPALVVYWDRNLNNRFANRASVEWFGLTPEQMRGRHIADITTPARYAEIRPYLESVLSGNSELFERPFTLASGEVRQALLSYTPDVKDGRVEGLYGVVSDITPLKHAQAGQALALAQLQSIINAASDFSIIKTNVEGTIKLFSSGAERMLGYAASELVDRATPALLHLADEMAARAVELTAEYGAPVSGFDVFVAGAHDGASQSRDWTYVRKDGTRLPVNLTVTAVRGPAGDIVGYLGIAKDIRAEREIRRVLAEARDQAQQASLMKSQFLANMSHEIRTPMNAVLGMLELLLRTQLTPLQRDYGAKSQSAARSLLGLLNDILDFSQVEADKIALESAPFSIESLMRDLAPILAALLGAKPVDLLFSIDPALPAWLQGDATRLRQVLINLASNAIKFTERGEVVVALRLRGGDASRSEVQFEVRDTGIGIGGDMIARVFDGFTQAETSTTRRFGGTGLGLTISQRLVDLMGGQLQVESTPDVGSRFHFSVTFSHPAQAHPPAPPDAGGLPAMRVLIVDASAGARTELAAGIAALGWSVAAVADAEQALRAIERGAAPDQAYDLVLLDGRMAHADGGQLAARIRAHGCGAPVIAMVTTQGRAALAERSEGEPAPLSGFLNKPFTMGMLADAIREARAAGPAMAAAASPHERRLAGLRLLVIDDNAMNQQVARELLVFEGAQVGVASGGALGLAMAAAAEPAFDAILLDIQMPGMDGYACARALRASAHSKLTPIVAMTANAMASEREACLDAGMNAHMSKPVDVDIMVGVLLAQCRPAPAAVAPAPAPAALAPAPAAPPVVRPFVPVPVVIEIGPALQRLGGNQALFVALAHTFADEAARFMESLRVALPGTDMGPPADLLHTFKSAAGMMGAIELEHYAARLEDRLRNRAAASDTASDAAPDADAILAEMARLIAASTAELMKISAAMAAASDVAPGSGAPPSPPPLPLPDLLAQLDALLGASNMRALDVFSTIELSHGAQLARRSPALAASMARLDFPRARQLCHQLQSELE